MTLNRDIVRLLCRQVDVINETLEGYRASKDAYPDLFMAHRHGKNLKSALVDYLEETE
jgi:hypothetical protein